MNALANVHSRDYLRKHVETPLCEQYVAAGALCTLSTNSECVLDAARRTFPRATGGSEPGQQQFSLRLWVDESDRTQPASPKPYLRGLDHLVYMGLDVKSSLLADLVNRRVIGRVSSAIASDTRYWTTTIFPMLMSILAGSLGLVELHASCVADGEEGLLLMGPGRSGKSTLAKAMSEAGFRILSDDRVFCSIRNEGLRAHGLPRPVKLRQDAGTWFEEFRDLQPSNVQNGEPVFHFDPEPSIPQPCEPNAVICLERVGDGCQISRMRRSEVRRRIDSELLQETPKVMEDQQRVIDALVEIPCWHLQYGARPEAVVEHLSKLLTACLH